MNRVLAILAATLVTAGCSLANHVGAPAKAVPQGYGLLLLSVHTDTPMKTLQLLNTSTGVDDTALSDVAVGHTVKLIQLPVGDYEWYRADLPDVLSQYGVYGKWVMLDQGGRHFRFSVKPGAVNYAGDLHFMASPANAMAVVVPQVNEKGAYQTPEQRYLPSLTDRLSIDLEAVDPATLARIEAAGLQYSGPGTDGLPAYLETLPKPAKIARDEAPAAPVTDAVGTYLTRAHFSRAVLSPDGASVLAVQEHPGFASQLMLIDLVARRMSDVAVSSADAPFAGLRWLSDDTAVYFGAGDRRGHQMMAIRWRRSPDGVRDVQYNGWYELLRVLGPASTDGALSLASVDAGADASKPACLRTARLDPGPELLKMSECEGDAPAPQADAAGPVEVSVTDGPLKTVFPSQSVWQAGVSTDGKTYLLRTGEEGESNYHVYRLGEAPLALGASGDPAAKTGSVEVTGGTQAGYRLVLPVSGQKPYPLVVITERDDAGSRQSDGMDDARSLLASRGYAVLSVRYPQGPQAPAAPTAAVRAVLAMAPIDQGRICIFGAGDGGYVALMAAARDAGRYRCAVSVGTVTDIGLLSASDSPQFMQETTERLSALAGISSDDTQALAAASPVYAASRLHVPVLLGDGVSDSASSEQANRMKFTLRQLGGTVDYVQDRFDQPRTTDPEATFYVRLLAFLDKYDAGGEVSPQRH